MTDIIELVERCLSETGMAPSRFGREACRDPRLVYDLRNGRKPSPATQTRIRAYLADPSQTPAASMHRGDWTGGNDEHLWAMLGHGIKPKVIAAALGVSVSAVRARTNKLADERLPDRPRNMRIADAIFAGRLQASALAQSL